MDRATAGISRLLTLAALTALATLCWVWLAKSEAVMSAMDGEGALMAVAMAMMEPTTAAPYLAATALMWIVMMGAMMTPAVLPVVLVFLRLDRDAVRGSSHIEGGLFAGGYLVVWFGFALLATLLQWALHRAALLHTHALAAGPSLAGLLLLGAGAYQLTPFKAVCLKHCQSPLGFLLGHWQDGTSGALRMGMRHGTYCVGCCWALMLLMFVSGVMSVVAMAILSVVVLSERLLPPGPWTTKVPALVLIIWGACTLVLGR